MSRHKQWIWKGIFLLGISLIFSGCAKKVEEGKVVIKYATYTGAVGMEIEKKVVEKFEKLHPNIKVEIIQISTGYTQKTKTMIAGGTPPDLMVLYYDQIPIYQKGNMLLELDDFIKADKDFKKEDIFEVGRKPYEIEGKQYGFPRSLNPIVLYYNKDMFDKANLAYPDETWTWDTFLAAAKKLTLDVNADGRIDQFGVVISSFIWKILVWQNGADFFDKEGRCTVNTPQVVNAFQWITDLIWRYHVCPTPSQRQDVQELDLFSMGKAAMYFCGHWNIPDLRKVKHLRWDVAPVPKSGNVRITQILSDGWVIVKQSKHPKETWEFLKFALSEEPQRINCVEVGYDVPVLKKVAYSDAFLNKELPPEHQEVFLEGLKYGRHEMVTLYSTEIWQKVIAPQLEYLILGKKTAKEICIKIEKEANKELEKLKEEEKR